MSDQFLIEDEALREKMLKVRRLQGELPYYRNQYKLSEGKLRDYQKKYNGFKIGINDINNVRKGIQSANSEIVVGRKNLGNYAGGNKYNEAMKAIRAVEGMCKNTDNVINSILLFAKKDMDLIKEKYAEEYKRYLQSIDRYNNIARQLRSLGVSCLTLERTIKKSSLRN